MNNTKQQTTVKHSVTLTDMEGIAQQLYALKNKCAIYTFEGSLGAGKTTLVRLLLNQWGIKVPVTSPTFNYVNIYQTDHNELLYHFDLYRLTTVDQFVQAGFDEFLYLENCWVFIEWPAVIEPLLKDAICRVTIQHEPNDTRTISFCGDILLVDTDTFDHS
ncbi:MAG: tRNA (adenosine(37)-N6)-threonylcarbamoyltransferase complex ATPase subunit type 1 TsaE [Candidatus Babeliales bacterium]